MSLSPLSAPTHSLVTSPRHPSCAPLPAAGRRKWAKHGPQCDSLRATHTSPLTVVRCFTTHPGFAYSHSLPLLTAACRCVQRGCYAGRCGSSNHPPQHLPLGERRERYMHPRSRSSCCPLRSVTPVAPFPNTLCCVSRSMPAGRPNSSICRPHRPQPGRARETVRAHPVVLLIAFHAAWQLPRCPPLLMLLLHCPAA